MRVLLLLFCMVLAEAGCRSSENAELGGVKWVLVSQDGEQIKLTMPDNEIFMEFNPTEKRVNGRAGCNRFFGNYEQDGSKLKFSPMGATRMACPDLQAENSFFRMLDGVDAYRIKNHHLTLLSKGKEVADFKASQTTN